MDDIQNDLNPDTQPSLRLRLRYAIIIYVAACLLMYLAVILGLNPGILFLLYLLIGVVLSRVVHRRLVDWHPVHKTIRNVANAKLSAVLFWPLSYLFLFAHLLIIKVL